VTTVGGDLIIEANATLTNLNGMSGVTSVGGDLIIEANFTLTNLDGLSGLTSVGALLTIADNPILPTCAAEALVARLRAHGWDGAADISWNDDSGTCP